MNGPRNYSNSFLWQIYSLSPFLWGRKCFQHQHPRKYTVNEGLWCFLIVVDTENTEYIWDHQEFVCLSFNRAILGKIGHDLFMRPILSEICFRGVVSMKTYLSHGICRLHYMKLLSNLLRSESNELTYFQNELL